MDKIPEPNKVPKLGGAEAINMANWRMQISELIRSSKNDKKNRPVGALELNEVIPAELTEEDADMWYKIKHTPDTISMDDFRKYEVSVRKSNNHSRNYFRAVLANMLSATMVYKDLGNKY
ncbi:MAG TPA: hypothetical protein VJC14_02440 [Candidatus Paceibacterota bacterium]